MAIKGDVGRDVRESILSLCRDDFRQVGELATLLGKSVHTVRAHYVYPMVRAGLLTPKLPQGSRTKQAYRTA